MTSVVVRGPSYPASEIPDARHALHVVNLSTVRIRVGVAGRRIVAIWKNVRPTLPALNFVRSVSALRSLILHGIHRAPAVCQDGAHGFANVFQSSNSFAGSLPSV